ncbi:MAG: chromate efflux transporter [Desulfuromonadales bacterium]|nr:chromate efflux transporter [Desulfuromonadales bacterium]
MQKLTVTQVFLAFLKLGLTSFGGPVAHLGYFRNEFVERRCVMQDAAYADLVSLCQFLPGPASSQIGIGIGITQAGLRGGIAAWVGFTLPSAIALVLFAYGIAALDESVVQTGWLHGLKVAAVAVVAQAILGMSRMLCPDWPRRSVAIFAALLTLILPGILGQMSAIGCGMILGLFFLNYEASNDHTPHLFTLSKKISVISLTLFFALLLSLPILAQQGSQALALVDSFYRSGALVFGGGHVVLPLLKAEVVNPGWINQDMFLAGYGAAQAVPGPLFTFAAYLGTAMNTAPSGWFGGFLCLLAIFLPSFLLVTGILPFWEDLRKNPSIKKALVGVNAAVVGLLLSAFYDPVWTSGILSASDFVLALLAFVMLVYWKTPPWIVVVATGVGGAIISYL